MYALLTGIFGKIYDDIIDCHIQHIPAILIESLKGLVITFTVLACIGDVSFSILITAFALATYGVDNEFWASFAVIGLVMILSTGFNEFSTNPFVLALFIIASIIIANWEDRAFPEEYSKKKLIIRSLGFIVFIGAWFILPYIVSTNAVNSIINIGDIDFIYKSMEVVIGGLAISICSQIYGLYNSSGDPNIIIDNNNSK